MGFLIESVKDNNGNVSMIAYYVYDVCGLGEREDWRVGRDEITEDTFRRVTKKMELSRWKKDFIGEDNFRLHFIFQRGLIDFTCPTDLQARNNRLYQSNDSTF